MLQKPFRWFFLAIALILILGCAFLQPQATPLPTQPPPAATQNAQSQSSPAVTQPAENLPTVQSSPTGEQQSLQKDNCPENLGKIVFAYDSMDDPSINTYEIYMMQPDGSGRTRLTHNDVFDAHPAWSPGRCRIVFTSYTHDGNDDIFTMNVDGTALRRLTTDKTRDIFPEWSPDGQQIAFVSYRDGFRNLYLMNADGSNQRQVTKNKEEYSQWLKWVPGGKELTFTFNPERVPGRGASIFVIHPDGSGQRQVTPPNGSHNDMQSAWSPDGKTLYFISNRSSQTEIWKINYDGSGMRQVSNLNAVNVTPSPALTVSPDGKQLAFYGVGPGVEQYNEEIYVINTDGSGLKAITRMKGEDEWPDW